MAKPFDNTTRYLTGLDPLSWARFLGVNAQSAELSNADLSTVATQADAIIITDHGKDALHVENMSFYDPEISVRLILYNVLGRRILRLPMRSFLVLLCHEADRPELSGVVRQYHSDGSLCHEFHYKVIRVWQIPAEQLFSCGLGVLPLAFIGDVARDKLPELVTRAEERLAREATPQQSAEIWTAIGILMGLKYKKDEVKTLLKGVGHMKESVTYQAIQEEGELKGAREMLVWQLTPRFGAPDATTLSALNNIQSLEELRDLGARSLLVSSWTELLRK